MKKRNQLILGAAAFVLVAVTIGISNAEESKIVVSQAEEGKSVAWYTANIKEAKVQNQLCHDNPAIKSSPDCVNALRGLEISFGVNH